MAVPASTAAPPYDILFQPVRIGPVTAPNRFYQVPHCSGMGYRRPHMLAAMRGMKAEGGWGVVCTEYCSIHPSSDDNPYPYARLWDADDVRANAMMVDAVHSHGALAGVELWHGGSFIANLATRRPTLGARGLPSTHASADPVQSLRMDKSDIRRLRRWHVDAAKRALEAGFDIVYVYAAHGYLLTEFLSPRYNDRSDEYGGSARNRARLVREILEDTKDAVGDRCAVACRFSVATEETGVYFDRDDSRELLTLLAELPDLWDVTVDDYSVEMGSSRFVKEAAVEDSLAFVKTVNNVPVVGVGRFTSPDTMVRQVRRRILDFIGAARPSIADPFLPRKIAEDRIDEIRECIGCNICYAHNSLGSPIRCTQNPTMGEEWRRGWHPEDLPQADNPKRILVVGAGPAGLEAALTLGRGGHEVILAEAGRELGGRVARESKLPGLNEWRRVQDWRVGRLTVMPNVSVYVDSPMSKQDVLDVGVGHVLIATGAAWCRDGIGRWRRTPFDGWQRQDVLTPDDVMDGARPEGPAVIYDDDHYYMAAALALSLAADGRSVTLVTTDGTVASWTRYTEELDFTNRALRQAGVEIVTSHGLVAFDGNEVRLGCVFTGREISRQARNVIPVAARTPEDSVYGELIADAEGVRRAGIESVVRIGDCLAPGTIAAAVYSGHMAARELAADEAETSQPLRERIVID